MARVRTAAGMNELTRNEQARINALARMLPGAAGGSPDQIGSLICALLDAAGIPEDRRLDALGGAFVSEAFRPYWDEALGARAAHDALRAEDAEIADAVEALSVMLLGRAETRERAIAALDAVEELFREA